MPVNFCKTDGNLGNILISPENISVSSGESIFYVITVSSAEASLNLLGEFKITSENLKTGDFKFQFAEQQKNLYSIKEGENGFSFKFSSNLDKIEFTLIPVEFAAEYDAEVTVDARSSDYGSVVAGLLVQPLVEQIQADNFEDYAEQYGLDIPQPSEPSTGTTNSQDKLLLSDKFSIINEYNFYIKDYEETTLNEVNLLNINANNRTIDIKQYFSKKPQSISYSNVILHSSEYMKNVYPLIDKQKFLFPMYMEFKFESDVSKTQLTSYLEKVGMLDYLCYFYAFTYSMGSGTKTFQDLKNIILNSQISLSDAEISRNFIGSVPKIKNFLSRSFQKTILIKLLEKQLQNVPELFQNEILMYKLDKFKNGTLLNSQYFINKFEYGEIIAFDTQLKYDTEYEYKISKIEILGNGNIVQTPIKEYEAKLRIVDSPPLPPDVSYIPYKGVDDQILINFNASAGRYADYPVIIKDSDIDIFNKILNNSVFSRTISNENKIQFESDDPDVEYQIFRLENAPNSYKDFSDSLEMKTTNTSILNDIKPNTKYYYIIRAVDIHGHISNPTKPIQIEMVNENGTIYLLKKEYVFGEETKLVSKDFRNIIQLKPSKQQLEINPELTYKTKPNATSAKEISLVLSNKEISIWNKPFMMRITSKMTGKKIDIKFKFTHSQPK